MSAAAWADSQESFASSHWPTLKKPKLTISDGEIYTIVAFMCWCPWEITGGRAGHNQTLAGDSGNLFLEPEAVAYLAENTHLVTF